MVGMVAGPVASALLKEARTSWQKLESFSPVRNSSALRWKRHRALYPKQPYNL